MLTDVQCGANALPNMLKPVKCAMLLSCVCAVDQCAHTLRQAMHYDWSLCEHACGRRSLTKGACKRRFGTRGNIGETCILHKRDASVAFSSLLATNKPCAAARREVLSLRAFLVIVLLTALPYKGGL